MEDSELGEKTANITNGSRGRHGEPLFHKVERNTERTQKKFNGGGRSRPGLQVLEAMSERAKTRTNKAQEKKRVGSRKWNIQKVGFSVQAQVSSVLNEYPRSLRI